MIALGSDIDGIPKSSQKPGVAFHDPIIEGAPGHGEGHNSGQAVIVAAAIVFKNIMEKENIKGTIRIWPGVAEELVATKAYFVRDGYFKDVDACIFTHVSSNLSTTHGQAGGNGLLSVEYTFQGKTAHSAGSPWRGRSALDAVELMNIGWNYRREHLRPPYRVHYVVTDGGDQPNVVPRNASVWYYLRELDYEHIMELFDYSSDIAEGAAKMSGTKLISTRILGSAWPRHFNEPIAQAMYSNIKEVGLDVNERGQIEINENMQTQVENIYAIGDVVRGAMLAHKAEEEGVLVSEFISGQKPHINYNLIPGVVYTWPEVAAVGKTEEELKLNNVDFKTGQFPMRALGRSRASSDLDGFVKILADKKSDEILGIHMIGARCADLISEAVVAMEFKASAEDIARISHAHPTFSEAVKEAALSASENRPIHI